MIERITEQPFCQTRVIGSLSFFNTDNIELMKTFADKQFDLAIVDPPYGLGKRTTDGGGTNSQIKFMDDIRRTNWDDKTPDKEYWEQLFRISKNQIIRGGNYFDLPPTRTIICRDKVVVIPTMSQIEIAWTSLDSPAGLVKINNTDKNSRFQDVCQLANHVGILFMAGKHGAPDFSRLRLAFRFRTVSTTEPQATMSFHVIEIAR